MQAQIVKHGPEPDPLLQQRSQSPSRDGKVWRHPKPSQGDFVLIDSLAGGNRPDLAQIAGEAPLVVDPPTEPEGLVASDRVDEEERELKQIAQKATVIVEVTTRTDENRNLPSKSNGQGRTRPTILTGLSDRGGINISQNDINTGREDDGSHTCISNSPRKRKFEKEMPPPTRKEASITERIIPRGQGEVSSQHCQNARLPELSQFAIPASEGSPMETLPAMKNTAMSSVKSHQSQQNLPGLQEHFGPLAGSPLSPDSSGRSAVSIRQNRIPFQTATGTGLPTPLDGTFPRSSGYSLIQARSAAQYPQGFGGQPSPASSTTMSESSPRDYNMKPDIISPTSRYTQSHSSAATPQSSVDLSTPISAGDSYSTYSSQLSPNGEQTSPEDSHGPYLNGVSISPTFKCDVAECTAPPFQTQYLLK